MEVLSCNAVHKSYQTGFLAREKKIALQNVTFQIQRHEVFGIIGPNGAGKSTILKILMGFVRPDSGDTKVNNQPPGSIDSHRHIGYLAEHPSLYAHLSPREHLQFACRVGGLDRKNTIDKIKAILQTVNLADVADTPIKRFSKGMTQRAALAYALLLEPKILILDEPMSGLDPLGRQLVIDIIQEYHNRGTTILFCSHILTDVERICDRIGIMNQGSMAAITTPSALLKQYPPSEQRGSKTPLESFFLNTIQEQNQ